MAKRLGYWDYVKEAFHRTVNVPLLGAMPANKMALAVFGVLGLANPGFWFLGAATEVVYLGVLSSSSRFQHLVRGERLLERAQSHDARVASAFQRLGHPAQRRFRALVDECKQILGFAGSPDDSGMFRVLRTGNLNELLWLFMRLLTSRELIQTTRAQVHRAQLLQDIEVSRQRLVDAQGDSPLARSLAATLEIQEKRLANLDSAEHNLAVVDAELERIEQQVRLIREESAVSGGSEMLSARLDAVSSTLTETSRWMDQHSEIFTSLAGEDDLSASLPTLPDAPAADSAPPPIPRPRKREREG